MTPLSTALQTTEGLQWIAIGELASLPLKTGKTVQLAKREIAVFRVAEDRVLAVHNRCPHKQGVLAEGMVSGDYVFCPMHDRKIDLTTGQVQLPDTGCVKTYPVAVENGMVYLGLPARRSASAGS